MTLQDLVVYGVMYLVIAGLIQYLMKQIIQPILVELAMKSLEDAHASLLSQRVSGEIEIDNDLFSDVATSMEDILHNAAHISFALFFQAKNILRVLNIPVPTDSKSESIARQMEKHPDPRVREIHKQWAAGFVMLLCANSPGVLLYLTPIVIVLVPVAMLLRRVQDLKRLFTQKPAGHCYPSGPELRHMSI